MCSLEEQRRIVDQIESSSEGDLVSILKSNGVELGAGPASGSLFFGGEYSHKDKLFIRRSTMNRFMSEKERLGLSVDELVNFFIESADETLSYDNGCMDIRLSEDNYEKLERMAGNSVCTYNGKGPRSTYLDLLNMIIDDGLSDVEELVDDGGA